MTLSSPTPGNAGSDRSAGAREPAWIHMTGARDATGALRAAYAALGSGSSHRPTIYTPAGGDVPNIVRCHSLDPEALRLVFGLSAAVHWGPHSLDWAEREIVNTVTSRANGCFY